ncbi:MAG: hypothetical protein IIY94_09695 [Oscillospiraceae bacterium]|nr:hypothetical protein [Oscillospiraceae bacterium]
MADQQPKSEKKPRVFGRRYRYTNDYKVVPALGMNGPRGNRILYIGQWYRPSNPAEEYRAIVLWLRIWTAVAILAAGCGMWLHPADLENRWYVPLLAISLFPLAYQLIGAVMLPQAVSYMERQRYEKTFVRIQHSAVFALVVFCLSALGCLVFWLVHLLGDPAHSISYTLGDGIFAGLLILAGIAELKTNEFSRKIQTDIFDNEAYQP